MVPLPLGKQGGAVSLGVYALTPSLLRPFKAERATRAGYIRPDGSAIPHRCPGGKHDARAAQLPVQQAEALDGEGEDVAERGDTGHLVKDEVAEAIDDG